MRYIVFGLLTDSLSVWKIYDATRIENGEEDPPRSDKKDIEELIKKTKLLNLQPPDVVYIVFLLYQ